jgi:hypothetical protein
VRELASRRPGGTEGAKPVAKIGSGQGAEGLNERWPLQGPAHGPHQFARQTKGKIEATHPGARLTEQALKVIQSRQCLQTFDVHGR